MEQKDTKKVDNRYEIVKRLGSGASGDVVLVKDADENLMALKFLKTIQMNISRDEALKNFKNEFTILKELNHPNIGKILDFGFDAATNRYYYTTELITGTEMHTACENQPMDVIEKTLVQALRAIGYLHSRGIYHYDIKPQNVLVQVEDGVPKNSKLIDFGLASFTPPTKKVGTPAYMAPEMINGERLDARTDLYSMGCLIYKILTGTNPFADKSLQKTFDNHLNVIPRPPSEVNPKVPQYWDHIVDRLLEKKPVNRYSQASLVIRDLNFLSNKEFEIETRDTKLSYLPERGTLIGREKEWQAITNIFEEVFPKDGTTKNESRLIIVEGPKGTGKSRLLSEVKYFSQLRNVSVKTYRQFLEEERSDRFVLTIDDERVDAVKLSALVQELSNSTCLILWAIEKAPQQWTDSTVIQLGNYNDDQIKEYLESVTGFESAPQKLINEVSKRTQGNPLFVTEFVKALLDQNLLFNNSGKWDAKTFEDIKIDFNTIHISSTVEEYLVEKYRTLPDSEREVLNWVIASEHGLDSQFLDSIFKNDGSTAIEHLIKAAIVEKTSDNLVCIKNPLMAEVVEKLIPQEQIAVVHDTLAVGLDDNSDNKEAWLYHVGRGSDKTAAKEALYELGLVHMAKPDYQPAIDNFTRSLNIDASLSPDVHLKAAYKLGRAYRFNNQYPESITCYTDLKTRLATENSDFSKKYYVKTCERLVDVLIKSMKLDDAQNVCSEIKEKLTSLCDAKDQQTIDLIFTNYEGFIQIRRGNIDIAEKIYLETQDKWSRNLDDEQKQRVVNNRLIEVYVLKRDHEKSIALCNSNLKILEKSRNQFHLASTHYAFGEVLYRQIMEGASGDRNAMFESGMKHLRECERLAREISNYTLMMSAFNGLGNIYLAQNNLEQALDYYNRALAIARQTNDMLYAGSLAYNIAGLNQNADRNKEAYSYVVYAINMLENTKFNYNSMAKSTLVLCYFVLTELYIKRGEAQKAHNELDKSEKIITENDFVKYLLYWAISRRAKIFMLEKNQSKVNEYLAKAKELAKSDEQLSDLKVILSLCGPQTASHSSPQTGNTVMLTQPDGSQPPQGVKIMTATNNNDDLKKIIEINKFINSEYNADQLLKIVLNYAIQLSNAEAGFVLILEEDGSFAVKASMNTKENDEEKISMSIAKMAIEKGEIISSSDALTDERFDSSESIVINELKSVLCLPIRSKNKSIGVFYLDNRYRTNAFDTVNVNLVNAFCDQVGIALENSKLINQLMQAQNQLEEKLEKTSEELAQVKNILKSESDAYKTRYAYKQIISQSAPMQSMFKLLDKVTETTLSVFIYGQSGTGKELVAKALHYNNPTRSAKRFVAINCGAIPANLMESELFGYKAGAFTGANKDKKGLFEEANGGTLFLDEIGELDGQLQVKLLRVLQEGEVQRIGDSNTTKVDVRIVCASHKDMADQVKLTKFREDLYYRLCQMKIDLPPLKDRSEDIPLLAKHFVGRFREQNKLKEEIQIPPAFMKAMLEYQWPGNVRELENLISVACALREGNLLALENIPPNYGICQVAAAQQTVIIGNNLAHMSSASVPSVFIDEKNGFDPSKTWQKYEAIIIAKCYEFNLKKKMPTAECLNLSHSTIYKKIEDLNLDDASNPLYAENFVYDTAVTMKECILNVFSAALKFHDNHPYAAIRQLDVSQGYFYKIMKEFKKRDEVGEEVAAK